MVHPCEFLCAVAPFKRPDTCRKEGSGKTPQPPAKQRPRYVSIVGEYLAPLAGCIPLRKRASALLRCPTARWLSPPTLFGIAAPSKPSRPRKDTGTIPRDSPSEQRYDPDHPEIQVSWEQCRWKTASSPKLLPTSGTSSSVANRVWLPDVLSHSCTRARTLLGRAFGVLQETLSENPGSVSAFDDVAPGNRGRGPRWQATHQYNSDPKSCFPGRAGGEKFITLCTENNQCSDKAVGVAGRGRVPGLRSGCFPRDRTGKEK